MRDPVASQPDHTRGAWRPANSVVIWSLRNQITTESTGQFYQDNQSASAPLSRQNRQTPRVLYRQMKIFKYISIGLTALILLLFSFCFHIYTVDYRTEYRGEVNTPNEDIEIRVSVNPTNHKLIWLPFFLYGSSTGPYKVVVWIEDLNKEWNNLKIVNAEYQDRENNTHKLEFTNRGTNAVSMTFKKNTDPNYGIQYFHIYTRETVQLPTSINLTVEFELSNMKKKMHDKFTNLIEIRKTKRISSWFIFLSA